jgi:hypothetical protein
MKEINVAIGNDIKISLYKEQISYYVNQSLVSVKDVSHNFSKTDLLDLAKRIALKQNINESKISVLV